MSTFRQRMHRRLFTDLAITALAGLGANAPAAEAAPPTGSLGIVTTTPNPTAATFSFALTPATVTGGASAVITGAGRVSLTYAPTASVSITEAVPASFGPVTVSQLAPGENCTFDSQWWFSSPTGAALTATTWTLATTAAGGHILGEGSSTITFS